MVPIGVQFRRPWAATGNIVRDFVSSAELARSHGLASVWLTETFDYDPLTVLAAISTVPGLRLGTAVAVTYARHPAALAAQALTVQAASGNRLTLGLGPSHRSLAQAVLGVRDWRPLRDVRAYLETLNERLTHEAAVSLGSSACDVLLGAMGPKMLQLAGALAQGTVTSRVGPRALRTAIVPAITEAAAAAGRPPPRVVACLPLCVSDDREKARALVAAAYASTRAEPVYERVLALEGVEGPEDVALLGEPSRVAEQIARMVEAGATELVVRLIGGEPERRRSLDFLASLAP